MRGFKIEFGGKNLNFLENLKLKISLFFNILRNFETFVKERVNRNEKLREYEVNIERIKEKLRENSLVQK